MHIRSLANFTRAQVRSAGKTSLDGIARQYLRPTVFTHPWYSISSKRSGQGGEVFPFAPKITQTKVVHKVGGDGLLLTTVSLTSNAVVVITSQASPLACLPRK
jgi:hypothetical protein